MINNLKEGDTIYVTDLSESNSYSDFLITVMSGVNQFERDLIKMR